MTDLNGRRALVLGAGSPEGGAIARALAGAGADVAVAAASLEGSEVMAVRRVRRAVEALGRRSAEYAVDVTLGANVQVSTRQVAKDLGGLEILVYAVDAPLAKRLTATTDADWARVLAANLSGAFYACRAAVREMTDGWGRMLLVVPVTERSETSNPAYRAARAGLAGLVHAANEELAATGISAHLLIPDALAAAAGVNAWPDAAGVVVEAGGQSYLDALAAQALDLLAIDPRPDDSMLINGYGASPDSDGER